MSIPSCHSCKHTQFYFFILHSLLHYKWLYLSESSLIIAFWTLYFFLGINTSDCTKIIIKKSAEENLKITSLWKNIICEGVKRKKIIHIMDEGWESRIPAGKHCRRGHEFHLAALAYPTAPPSSHSQLSAVVTKPQY